MGALSSTLQWVLLIWLGALAAVIAWRLLSGQIHLQGLLREGQAVIGASPERIQMLAATVLSAAAYIQLALHTGPQLHKLPDVPPELLGSFAASHGVYLSTKLGRRVYGGLQQRRRSREHIHNRQ